MPPKIVKKKDNRTIKKDITEIQESDKYEFNPVLQKEIFFLRPEQRLTSEIITKYELCRIISIRAKQIEKDNIIFTDVTGITDPIKMAEKEIYDRKCPLSIIRKLNNNTAEKWDVNEMILN